MGENVSGFISRAIFETIERDAGTTTEVQATSAILFVIGYIGSGTERNSSHLRRLFRNSLNGRSFTGKAGRNKPPGAG